MKNFLTKFFCSIIIFYQKYISPLFPACCRFKPTCSQYALEAIKKYGIIVLLVVVGCISHICNGRISMTANKFGKSFVLFYITAVSFSVAVMMVTMILPRFHFVNFLLFIVTFSLIFS